MSFSKYQTIDLKKESKSDNSHQFNDVFMVGPEEHRFGQNSNAIVLPSTDVTVYVRVAYEVKKGDVPMIVSDAVEAVGARIVGERIEGSDPASVRIGYRLSSVFDSILLITKLHGIQTRGCLLDISFAP